MRPLTQPKKKLSHWILLLLLWVLTTASASPVTMQSHDSIRAAAEQHILDEFDSESHELSATAGRLDNRLRLAACKQPLETFTPHGRRHSAKVTVGVRCNDASSWTLYVPVTIANMKSVVTASRELPRGIILTPADIKTEIRDVARLHRGYLQHPEEVMGKKLKRPIHAGAIVTPGQLAIQHAVKKGSQVIILAQIGPLQVRMKGKALANGAIGERITVENSSSNRQVEATVISPGVVQTAT